MKTFLTPWILIFSPAILGLYNRIGRGFPDISAVGHWWLDFNEGEEGGWGGTSMSAPIVASIINRVRTTCFKRSLHVGLSLINIACRRLLKSVLL